MEPWKKAQEKLKNYLNTVTRKDFWYKAFTDTYAAGGKIVQDQPSDFWALDRGIFCVLEVKSCHQPKFYFKDVRPSQFIAARRVVAAGGISRFLIVKLPEWQWHIVDGSELWRRKEAGDAGITWAEMTPIKLDWEAIRWLPNQPQA